MADIDISRLNIDQLTELVGKAQTEVASRDKQRRKDLRSELDRRLAAEGYALGDIFPELGSGAVSGSQRQKRPAKYRNPQNSEQTWSGIGRSPKWVQAILERAGDRRGGVQGDSDVPDTRVEPAFRTLHWCMRTGTSRGKRFDPGVRGWPFWHLRSLPHPSRLLPQPSSLFCTLDVSS